MSQRLVAFGAGISAGRFWRIENGFAEPTEAERAAIAQALDVAEWVLWPTAAVSAAMSGDGYEADAG